METSVVQSIRHLAAKKTSSSKVSDDTFKEVVRNYGNYFLDNVEVQLVGDSIKFPDGTSCKIPEQILREFDVRIVKAGGKSAISFTAKRGVIHPGDPLIGEPAKALIITYRKERDTSEYGNIVLFLADDNGWAGWVTGFRDLRTFLLHDVYFNLDTVQLPLSDKINILVSSGAKLSAGEINELRKASIGEYRSKGLYPEFRNAMRQLVSLAEIIPDSDGKYFMLDAIYCGIAISFEKEGNVSEAENFFLIALKYVQRIKSEALKTEELNYFKDKGLIPIR